MYKAKQLIITLSVLILISLTGIISAQTLVAGKIYDKDYNLVSGADVTLKCRDSSLNTASLDDGTYALAFEILECQEGDFVKIDVSKNGLTGTLSGIVEKNEESEDYKYILVKNVIIKEQTQDTGSSSSSSSSGSSSGGNYVKYYLCGNKKCDTGETIKTCPKDCTPSSSIPENTLNLNTENTPEPEGDDKNTPEPKNFGITGAVIGFAKTKTGIGIGIALIIIISGIAILTIQKKNKQQDQSES